MHKVCLTSCVRSRRPARCPTAQYNTDYAIQYDKSSSGSWFESDTLNFQATSMAGMPLFRAASNGKHVEFAIRRAVIGLASAAEQCGNGREEDARVKWQGG